MALFELPLAEPKFTASELGECQTEGKCCHCGWCCIAFEVDDVPSIPGDLHSPRMKKISMERCPQMTIDISGRVKCLLHTMKVNGAVPSCASWEGNKYVKRTSMDSRGSRVGYENLSQISTEIILNPFLGLEKQRALDPKNIQLLNQAVISGRVPHAALQKAANIIAHRAGALRQFLRKYLLTVTLLQYPDALFKAVHLQGAIARHTDSIHTFLNTNNFPTASESDKGFSFWRAYGPAILTHSC